MIDICGTSDGEGSRGTAQNREANVPVTQKHSYSSLHFIGLRCL